MILRSPSFSHPSFLHTIITVSPLLSLSLSHSFPVSISPPHLSLSLSLYQSITHSDSLCKMPSSKLNSTLLDLQPFPSSKWLTSVITLQPEWETQRRGREEGWQTETWHERRGNAGLIIHTYCSKKRGGEREETPGGKTKWESDKDWPKWGGIPSAAVHSGSQSCDTLGPWVWGNSAMSCQKTAEREREIERERIRERYSWISWKLAH